MERKHRFVPQAPDGLEARVVLSRVGVGRGISPVVSGLYPGHQVLNRRQQPVVAAVNQAFDSFTSDYAAARAAYFASILDVANPSADTKNAFVLYTKQRVSLLANQVIGNFLQYAQGTARGKGQPDALRQLVSTKIISPQGQEVVGSLASALTSTIPPPGTSAATASIYSLSQDNAIASARVAVLNGVNIVKNGDFGNRASHH